MAAKENEVDWKSALSIKRALVKRNLSTKTPNLKGDARLQALQTRLRTFLSSQAHVNNINDKAAKNRPYRHHRLHQTSRAYIVMLNPHALGCLPRGT